IAPVSTPPVAYRRRTLKALMLATRSGPLRVPVDTRGSVRVPFRGPGGAHGGAFRYVSAPDAPRAALGPGELKGKIVLVGSSAPGLDDLRTTPVGTAFAGVE